MAGNVNAPLAGSLFSGAGGLDLGLTRAGFRHAFLCERDEWRRGILTQHWPGVTIYKDVRDVAHPAGDGRRGHMDGTGRDPMPGGRREQHGGAPGRVRSLDLLAGGFPCQDVSVAGRRAGLTGERSGLFHEFTRVADELVRPGGWVLVENVPGLFSSNRGRDFAVVLAALADIGFMDGAWRILDAQHFGVPQRRRRIFILARRAPHRDRARQVLLEPEGGRGDLAPRYPPWTCPTGGPPIRVAGALTRPGRLDDCEVGGGQLVVNALDRQSGGPDDNAAQAGHIIAHTLTSAGHDASDDGSGRGTPLATTGAGVRRLTPTECERLMGWPDGWTEPGSDSRRYSACGDGVVSFVAEWIGRRLHAEMNGDL